MCIRYRYLHSEELRLAGFADIVEEEEGMLIPVEYKHGKEGKWLNDHVQLCARHCAWKSDCPTRLLFLTDIFSTLVRASGYRCILRKRYEKRQGGQLTLPFR